MIADRLKTARFRGCWLVRLPPGASIRDTFEKTRLGLRLAMLVGSYVAQYVLFVLSWWLLGHAVLTDTVDRGALLGWLLLLASLVPVRLVATWNQGAAVVAAGVWLRRRLLRGASRIDRQELRRKGGRSTFRPGDRSSRDRCAGTHRRNRGDLCADRVGDRVSRVVGWSNFSGRAAASRLGRRRRLSRLAISSRAGRAGRPNGSE